LIHPGRQMMDELVMKDVRLERLIFEPWP